MQQAAHESPRAIDRIDDPGQTVSGVCAEFLSEDSVFGITAANLLTYHSFSCVIGLSDWIEPAIGAFVLHARAGTKKGKNCRPCGGSQPQGELQQLDPLRITDLARFGIFKHRGFGLPIGNKLQTRLCTSVVLFAPSSLSSRNLR